MDVTGIAVAVSILGTAAIAAHVALRWMTLAHGRMLSADKQGQFERELTAQALRMNAWEAGAIKDRTQLREIEAECSRLDGLTALLNSTIINDGRARMAAVEDSVVRLDHNIDAFCGELKTFCQKNDAGLINLALDVQKLVEKESMALAGIAATPKKGFRIGGMP